MDEIALSQAVKEALLNLAQEIGQSYRLPAYLKPLLNGEATVNFKVYKGKVLLSAPEPVIIVTETPIEVEKLETPIIPIEQSETAPPKPKRKRRSEV